MTLGENIYKQRSEKGWSQSELAEMLEVSRQSVSKWENDQAIPDLERLIRMKNMFDISLDTLVFGEQETEQKKEETPVAVQGSHMPFRVYFGMALLVFGMIFFLLSIFWGDHLYFGEAFGELLSAVIVLVSVAIVLPYDFRAFATCALIFLIYSIISFGVLKFSNVTHYIFSIIASVVIIVWFIICGEHATKDKKEKANEQKEQK